MKVFVTLNNLLIVDYFKLKMNHLVASNVCACYIMLNTAPRLGNGLPMCLRSANTLDSFPKFLKTFLFKDAYNL